MLKILISFTVFLITLCVQADVLFEGYYKVTQMNNHIGFIVVRNEVDTKTKQFKTTSFLRLAKNGFDITESLSTVSGEAVNPISYTYLSTEGKNIKTIDAEVQKNKLVLTTVDNGKKTKSEIKINKDMFFSSALFYMILKSKTGLKTNTNFEFTAIAEETGKAEKGFCDIDKKLISEGKLQLLKAQLNYGSAHGSKYENLVTDKGEIISAYTPATDIKTQLVKNVSDAIMDIKMPSGLLEKVFGSKPEGKINPL